MTSTMKGGIAEARITAEAVELGVVVLRPLVEGRRYDLVFDVGGQLLRVQCKWASLKGDVVVIYTGGNRQTPRGYVRSTYTAEEVDAIAAYCAATRACYLIPIAHVAGRHVTHLRLAAAANNQKVAIKYAADYEFTGAVAQLGERRHGMAEVRGSIPLSSIEASEAAH